MAEVAGATQKTAVVTGSSGFLGRHIVWDLGQQGWATVGVDRVPVSTDGREDPFAPDVSHTLALPSDDLGSLLADVKPGALIHAAGLASVAGSIEDPAADFAASVPVFFNVLDSVRTHAPTCRVLLLSSAAVYGEPRKLPVTEEQPAKPLSPYGYHKAVCEMMLSEFNSVYGVAGASARIFSAYGPGLNRQVMWDICRKAKAGRLELFGTGAETRDFIHADDAAAAIRLIVENGYCAAEAYNVAGGVATSISDLARMLLNRMGSEVEPIFSGERREGDPVGWCADISLLRGLGYQPSISLETGTAEYAAWFLAQGPG